MIFFAFKLNVCSVYNLFLCLYLLFICEMLGGMTHGKLQKTFWGSWR